MLLSTLILTPPVGLVAFEVVVCARTISLRGLRGAGSQSLADIVRAAFAGIARPALFADLLDAGRWHRRPQWHLVRARRPPGAGRRPPGSQKAPHSEGDAGSCRRGPDP